MAEKVAEGRTTDVMELAMVVVPKAELEEREMAVLLKVSSYEKQVLVDL